jgi:hypothetical protein
MSYSPTRRAVVSVLTVALIIGLTLTSAHAQVGRWQVVPISGTGRSAVLVDTMTGCTWFLVDFGSPESTSRPAARRWFVFLPREEWLAGGVAKSQAVIPTECAVVNATQVLIPGSYRQDEAAPADTDATPPAPRPPGR